MNLYLIIALLAPDLFSCPSRIAAQLYVYLSNRHRGSPIDYSSGALVRRLAIHHTMLI